MTSRSWGLLSLVVAVLVAAGAFLYLKSAEERLEQAIEEATTPPSSVVPAPQLFPPDTRVFVAVHGIDRAFEDVERWWQLIEPTALYQGLREEIQRARGGAAGEIRKIVDQVDKALSEVETRFGHRPTTRDFFDTYGKYTAAGILGATEDGDAARFLMVVRLPGETSAEMLENQLARHDSVVQNDPPLLHGYPVFYEDQGDAGRVFYGVGRGFLFLGQRAADLEDAMGRLRSILEDDGAPASLADSDVFARGVPGAWEDVRTAFYLRKEQRFEAWDEELSALDEYVRMGFLLAGDDPAIAVSTCEGEDGWIGHSSFRFERDRPLVDVLPAGAVQCDLIVSVDPEHLEAAHRPQIEAFAEKEIWKEIAALLGDPERLGKLIEEALPPDMRPDADQEARFEHDARLVAEVWRGLTETALFTPPPPVALVIKRYGSDETLHAELAFAFEAEPLTAYAVTGLLEAMRANVPDPAHRRPDEAPFVRRHEQDGALSWTMDIEALWAHTGNRFGDTMSPTDLGVPLQISIVLGGGRLFLTMGDGIRAEIAGLLGGEGKPLSGDPVFTQALAAVDDGYMQVSYERPAELARAIWNGYWHPLSTFLASRDREGTAERFLPGVGRAVMRAADLSASTRATIEATYPGRPVQRVTLHDASASGEPSLLMSPAEPRTLGLLPESTWVLLQDRIRTEETIEALSAAFVEGFGGKVAWRDFLDEHGPVDDLVERAFDDLVCSIDGEIGIAIAAPAGLSDPEGPRLSAQEIIDRLPAITFFAEYEMVSPAFDTWTEIFEEIHHALNPTPFEDRVRRFQRGIGSAPFGTRYQAGSVAGIDVCALTFIIPIEGGEQYVGFPITVVARERFVFVSTSAFLFRHFARIEDGEQRSLAVRLADEIPEGVLPTETRDLSLFRSDGLMENLRLYLDPLVPSLCRLTLQGYRGSPPPERLEAHEAGWARAIDLLEDLLRTGRWEGAWTERVGDRSTRRSLPPPEPPEDDDG